MRYARLGDLLVKSGTISEEQLKEALSLQSGTGERLGSVLQEHGIITEKQLIDTLMSQLGVEFVDLNTYHIPAEMAQIGRVDEGQILDLPRAHALQEGQGVPQILGLDLAGNQFAAELHQLLQEGGLPGGPGVDIQLARHLLEG